MAKNSSPLKASSGSPSCLSYLLFTLLMSVLFLLLAGAVMASSAEYPQECRVSDRFPDSVLQWCGLITKYSTSEVLDPDLVAALIWQESGGKRDAYSHSGAVGLMQVMPSDGIAEKFRCPKGPCFADRPLTSELMDPEFNIKVGTNLLRGLVDHYGGDIRQALRAYGPMDVGYRYADTVLRLHQDYRQP
ncbi:MAG: hypothetical protein EHM41_25980 [Chloroflexi bacterium]|nr:MAG: hypothetical protein EHM41_25980 [Chloroflexota bacterium]